MTKQISASVDENVELSTEAATLTSHLAKPGLPLLTPHEALELLYGRFQKVAKNFSGKDSDLRGDLFQEMCVAVLECEAARQTRTFYGRVGVNRAKDYLRWLEVRSEERPLSEVKQEPVYEPRHRPHPLKYREYLQRPNKKASDSNAA